MQSVCATISWQFLRRHLISLSSCLVSLILTSALIHILRGAPEPPLRGILTGSTVLMACILLMQLMHLIAVFGFAVDGDLLSCESCYPSHMLRLPLSTRSLATWPLLLGAVSILLFCLAVWYIVVAPMEQLFGESGFPLSVTPILCLALLACVQAAMWATFRSPQGRAAAAISAVTLPIGGTVWAHYAGASAMAMNSALLLMTAVAYMLAVHNLGRARSGMSFGWPVFARPGLATTADSVQPARPQMAFRSTMRSLVWYEWARYFLPLSSFTIAASVLCPWLTFPSGRDAAMTIAPQLQLLCWPVLILAIGSSGIGGLNHRPGDRRVSSFLSSRPVSSTRFVTAKWIAGAISALLLFILCILMFALTVWWFGNSSVWRASLESVTNTHGFNRVLLGGSVLLVLYPLVAWVLMVQILPATLFGRSGLETLVISACALVGGLTLLIEIARDNDSVLFACVVVLLLVAKVIAALATLTKVVRYRLISTTTVCGFLLCWLLVVLSSIGVVYLFELTKSTRSFLLAAAAVILFWPITRLASAPLALHWHRHG